MLDMQAKTSEGGRRDRDRPHVPPAGPAPLRDDRIRPPTSTTGRCSRMPVEKGRGPGLFRQNLEDLTAKLATWSAYYCTGRLFTFGSFQHSF